MEKSILTNDQIDEISEAVEEYTEDSTTKEYMKKAKEEAAKDHEGYSENAIVVENPFTGKPMLVTEEEDDDEFNLGSFEDMMNDDSITPMTIDESKIKITEKHVTDEIESIFSETVHLSQDDIETIIELANRVKNKEEFSYYASMPEVIKNAINRIIGLDMGLKMGNFVKEGRNYIASSILTDIVNNATSEILVHDLQKSIKSIKKDATDKIKQDAYWDDSRKYLMYGVLDTATKLDAEGKHDKAEQYREVNKAFLESLTMEDMLEKYKAGKIRIKKIEIEKFKRECESFNMKYRSNTNIIRDINLVLPSLDRHADKKFDINTIKEFICVFIKYCMNKNPNNITDHTFMYNWISNMLSLDIYNRNDEFSVNFHDQLINNINNFLQVISDKHKKE